MVGVDSGNHYSHDNVEHNSHGCHSMTYKLINCDRNHKSFRLSIAFTKHKITDGLGQDYSISSVLAIKMLQSCTKLSIYDIFVLAGVGGSYVFMEVKHPLSRM